MLNKRCREPRQKIPSFRRASVICAVPRCPGFAVGLSQYCREHQDLAPQSPVPITCSYCRQAVARLHAALRRLKPNKEAGGRGRPAIELDGEGFFAAIYTIQDWLTHLSRQPSAKLHLTNVGVPEPILGTLRSSIRALRWGTLERRGPEIIARLIGVSARTLRNRIAAFERNRGAFLVWATHQWPPRVNLGGLVFSAGLAKELD